MNLQWPLLGSEIEPAAAGWAKAPECFGTALIVDNIPRPFQMLRFIPRNAVKGEDVAR